MKYMLLIIIIGIGNGNVEVPISHSIEFANKETCETAKDIVISDLKTASIAHESYSKNTLRKSDEGRFVSRNYSITCLPDNK